MFEQTNVACHQRRGGKAEHLPERKVPGHNCQHGPKWLEMNVTLRCICLDDFVREMIGKCPLPAVTWHRAAGRSVLQIFLPFRRLPDLLMRLPCVDTPR